MMTLSRSSQGDSVKKDNRKRYIDTSDDSRSDRDRRDKKKYLDLSSSKRDRRDNRDDRSEHGSSSRLSRDHDSSDTLNRKSQDRESASSDKGNLCKSLVDYAESDKEAKHDERYTKKKKKKKKKHSGKPAENDSDNSSEGPKPEKRRRLSSSSKRKKKSSKWSSDEEDALPKKEQTHGASISQESSFKKEANKESSHVLKNRWDDKEKAESSYDWRKERNDSVGEKDRVRSKWDFDTSDDDEDEDDEPVSLKVSESQSSKGLRSVVGDLSKEKSSRWSSAKESADESDDDVDGNDKKQNIKEQTDRSSSKDRESLFASSDFSKEGSVENLKRKGKLLETQEGSHKVLKVSKEFSGKSSRREDLLSSGTETGSTVIESMKGQSSDSVDTRVGEQTELKDSLEERESLRESQNDSPELETRAKERISLKGKQSPLGKIEIPKDSEKCHFPESEVVGDQSRESKIGEKSNRKNETEEKVKDRDGDGDLSKVSNSVKNDTAVSLKQKPQPESYGLEGLKSSREVHSDKEKDDMHITDEDREKLQMKRRLTSERCVEGKKQSLVELKETSKESNQGKETLAESDKYGDLPGERGREQYAKGSGHDTEPLKKCRSPEKDGNIEEGSDSKGSRCNSEEKNVSEKHGRQRENLKLSRWDRDASDDSNKESGGSKDKKKNDSGDLSLEKEDLKNQHERDSSKERFKGKADSHNQHRERSDSESGHSERSDSREQRHRRNSSKVHHVEGSDSESSHHDKSESEDQHSTRSDSDHQSRDKISSKRQRNRDDSRSRHWERGESSDPHRERDESRDRHQEKEDYNARDLRRDRDSSRERRRNTDDSRERHYTRDDSRERHRDRDSYDTKRSRDDSRERQKDRDDYGGRYRYRDQPRDNWRFRDNRRYQNDGWDNRRGRFNFRGGFKYRDSSRERQRYRDDSRDYRRDRDNRKDSDRDNDKHRRQDSYDQRHSSWRDRNRSSSPDRYRSKENSGRDNKTRKSDTSSSSKRFNGSPDRHHSADSSPDHHRSNDEKSSGSAQKNQQQEKRTTDLSDKPTSDTSVPKPSGSGETTTASSKPIDPSKDPAGAGILTTRTGGAYIPPARLKMMQTQITDKSSVAYQRLSWEALRKSINGHINKVNVTNIIGIVRDLFQENIVRGRGLLARSLLQAQIASPTFTHVYAALVAIINTKFPQNGELILRRLIIQFRRAFKRNDKTVCISSCRYIAHLVNQQVAHEVIALEILTLLLENPTNNSVEVAVGFLKECGQKLTEVSPRGVNAIFERLKNILHEGKLEMRTQYIIEVMFAVRKDGFKDHLAVIDELDLVLEADQFTHLLTLDDAVGGDDILNVFKQDDNFLENEEKYNLLKEEILNSSSDESSDESGDGSQSDSGSEAGGGGADDAENSEQIIDKTETNLVALRCTIYLTIQSSVDFEECAHKLLKMDLKPGQEIELCNMILDCCAQERTYQKFFGLLAQRFCMVDKKYVDPFQQIFKQQYETIHRLDPDKFRNVAKFFAHLLHTDAISWQVMSCIKLSKEDTSSASRIFLKILFQELSEYMGLPKLNYRFKDPTLQPYFEGIMPRDVLKNTRFAINFFTTIGLGGLTDDLREHLKNMAKVALQQKQPSMNSPASGTEDSSSDSSSDSSDSSSDSSGNSSDSSSDSSDSTPADKAEAAVKKKKVLTKKRPVAKDSAGANSKTTTTTTSHNNNNNNNNNKLVAVSNNISSKKKKKNQSSSSSSSGSSSSGSSSSSSSSSESSSSDSSSSSSSDSDDSLSSSSSNGSSSNAGGEDEHTVDSSESSTDSGSSSDSSSSSSSASSSSSDTMRSSTALDEKRRRDKNEATTSSVNHKRRPREDHSSGRDAINGLNQQGYTTAGGSHRKESRLGPRETDERVTHLTDTRDRNHERDHRPMEWSRNDSAGTSLPPPRNSRGGGGGSDDDDDEIERSRRVRGGEKRGSRSGGGYIDRVGSYASSSSNTADQWDKNRRDWDRSQNRGYELDRYGDRGDRTDRYYDKDRNGDRSDRYYDKERNERESYRRNNDGNGGRRDPRQKRYRNDYVNNSNNRRDSYIQKDRVGHGDRERTEKYRNRD